MTDAQTTYDRAAYDKDHERALMEAITRTIFETSVVSDVNAIVLRTGETTEALLTALAGILAMSPSATRSPTALRRTIDEFGKRLRRRVASAEQDLDLKEFVRRSFWNTGEGGKGRGRGSKQSGKRHEPWAAGSKPGRAASSATAEVTFDFVTTPIWRSRRVADRGQRNRFEPDIAACSGARRVEFVVRETTQ